MCVASALTSTLLFVTRTVSSVSELAASINAAAPVNAAPGWARRPWTIASFVIFTAGAPVSEKTRLASFPLIVVAAAPAPSISSFLLTTSWPEVSLIVPAGTMIVDPGGAVAMAWRSVPGPELPRLVTWTIAADAVDGTTASARAAAASPSKPRRCVNGREGRIVLREGS